MNDINSEFNYHPKSKRLILAIVMQNMKIGLNAKLFTVSDLRRY